MVSLPGSNPNAMTNEPKRAKNGSKSVEAANKLPLYFLSLEVEKVLCFKDRQVLDLSDGNGNPAQWTVILGNNSVGKTTLLRCLAAIEAGKEVFNGNDLAVTFIGPTSTNLVSWQEREVLAQSHAKILNDIACSASFSPLSSNQINRGKARAAIQKITMELTFESPLITKYDCVPEDSWETLRELIRYGYGATRRMGKSLLSESLSTTNSESLFSDEAQLINVEEWLLQTDYAAKSALGETRDRLRNQFNQIKEILKRILPDVEDIRISLANQAIPRQRAEFLTPYGWVRLSSLGLGYQTAIAWMVDLAVRLFRRYPNSEDPLAEPAIVLVDEIDLHLHPKWQRTIMSFLTERFPNTQFIVTAHSPLVVQAAKDANIVLLRREGDRVIIDNDPEIVDNWRVDQVLTSVFELPTARSASLELLLLRREEILSKAHLSEADEVELQELATQIGSLPTAESPDDIEAMDIIRRAAKLLENA